MLYTIAVILLVLWLLGLVSSYTLGGFIHILLVVAIVVVLINAIQGAGAETTLADLKRLVDLMDGADRLSLTFRFEDGSSTLDATSRDNLMDLAQLIATGQFPRRTRHASARLRGCLG